MVIKREMWYPPTESIRMLHIYFPDEYPYTEERYPVMYFFDGHNLFSDQDATMRWIVQDIKQMIDREYRTWGHREATGIGGSSMGGIMAIYGLVKYNWCRYL